MRTRTLILLLMLVAATGLVSAQDDQATQSPVTTVSGEHFTINYPQGWVVEDEGGRTVTIANQRGLEQDPSVRLPEDAVILGVGTQTEATITPPDVDIVDDPTPLQVLEAISEVSQPQLTLDAPTTQLVGDYPAAMATGSAGENTVLLLVWELDEDTYGTIAALTGATEVTQHEDTIFEIAASMRLTDDVPTPMPATPTTSQASVTIRDETTPVPVEVVKAFYDWYLSGYRAATDEAGRAVPLGVMTGNMFDQIQSSQGATNEALVCASGDPTSIALYPAGMGQGEARVVAFAQVTGMPVPRDVQVDLIQRDGQWLVDGVRCDLTPQATAEVVFTRYGYFMQAEQLEADPVERFADDWDFPWGRYITGQFLEQQAESDGDLRFDPFLCAQDVPAYVRAEIVAETDIDATVAVSGSYPSGDGTYTESQLLEAELLATADGWKLNVVSCVSVPSQ